MKASRIAPSSLSQRSSALKSHTNTRTIARRDPRFAAQYGANLLKLSNHKTPINIQTSKKTSSLFSTAKITSSKPFQCLRKSNPQIQFTKQQSTQGLFIKPTNPFFSTKEAPQLTSLFTPARTLFSSSRKRSEHEMNQMEEDEELQKSLQQAQELEDQGKFDQATVIYNTIAETFPNVMIPNQKLGTFHFLAERYETSMKYFQKVLSLDSQSMQGMLGLGWCYFKIGMHRLAIEEFSRALTMYPQSVQAYMGRAEARSALKEYFDAIEDLKRGLSLDNDNQVVRMSLAEVYTKDSQFSKALDIYSSIIMHPASKESLYGAYIGRGIIEYEHDKHEAAVENYTQAIGVLDNISDAYSRRAAAYVMLGQIKEGIDDSRKAIALDPENVLAYLPLGQTLFDAKEYEEARQAFTDYLTKQPEKSDPELPQRSSVHLTTAVCCLYLLKKAVPEIEFPALAIDEDPHDLHSSLLELQSQLDTIEETLKKQEAPWSDYAREAVQHIQQGINIFPDNLLLVPVLEALTAALLVRPALLPPGLANKLIQYRKQQQQNQGSVAETRSANKLAN